MTVASAFLWTVGGALVVVGAFAGLWLIGVGLWLSGVGALLSIQRMFVRMECREREAFELGREVGSERLHAFR